MRDIRIIMAETASEDERQRIAKAKPTIDLIRSGEHTRHWQEISTVALDLTTIAMREARTNQRRGSVYNAVFGALRKEYLPNYSNSTISRLLWFHDDPDRMALLEAMIANPSFATRITAPVTAYKWVRFALRRAARGDKPLTTVQATQIVKELPPNIGDEKNEAPPAPTQPQAQTKPQSKPQSKPVPDTLPPGQDELARRINAALAREKQLHAEWVEDTLTLAAKLSEARKLLPDESAFSAWLAEYDLNFDPEDLAALIGFATDLKLARTVLEETEYFSAHRIYERFADEFEPDLPKPGETLHFEHHEPGVSNYGTVWESTEHPGYYHCRVATLRGEGDDMTGEVVFTVRAMSGERLDYHGRSVIPIWSALADEMGWETVTKRDVLRIGEFGDCERLYEKEADEVQLARCRGEPWAEGKVPEVRK